MNFHSSLLFHFGNMDIFKLVKSTRTSPFKARNGSQGCEISGLRFFFYFEKFRDILNFEPGTIMERF